ncbi:MAG TPA: DUF6473 family protein [Caulobacteraceae bacterium]|jgi:hypothetical protein
MLSTAQVEQATRRGVEVAGNVLKRDVENRRLYLWREFFRRLYEMDKDIASYQHQDFELIDYDMRALPGVEKRLFRGPLPSPDQLASGDYICLLGAAQFLGRFQRRHLQSLIAERLGAPVLNLAGGARGPQDYLNPGFRRHISRARVVIVQVLSGRSTGDKEYPGGIVTLRKDTGETVQRLTLLKELARDNPSEYRRLVRSWNSRYLMHYRALANMIKGRKVLVWMSQRAPADWNIEKGEQRSQFGPFPHLIDQGTVEALRSLFDEYIEVITPAEAVTFTSRATGEPCPFMTPEGETRWSSNYYPSEAAHHACFEQLAPLIQF